LVVTADDFGLATEVNDAVELAHRKGILTAASLMVIGTAASRAVALAKRMPSLRVGLHLTLLEGAPAAPLWEIPNLVDAEGRLRRDMVRFAFSLALHPSLRRQLRNEIAAQFSAFRRSGLALDHVNVHKHFHVHPMIAQEVVAACVENGAPALRVPREPAADIARVEGAALPQPFITPWIGQIRTKARRARLLTPKAVFGLRWSGRMTGARLIGLLRRLPEGLIEIYTHPATSDAFPGHTRGYRYTEELIALADPETVKVARRSGHHAGGYLDFTGATPAQLADAG
jgi:hopanoid biosynthesis associated protein HpnK